MKKIMILLLAVPTMAMAQQKTEGAGKMPFKKGCEKTTFLPFIKKGYHPQLAASLVGGIQNNSGLLDASSTVYGVEISMQCPLLCTGKNYIRQQLSIVQQNGDIMKSVAAELNPHYRIIALPKFELGIGPSLGLAFATANNDDRTVFTYGAGVSLAHYFGRVFIGAESRYALSGDVNFHNNTNNTTLTNNLNNLRSVLKLGVKL
jgi:opacity protein-like surface antigen